MLEDWGHLAHDLNNLAVMADDASATVGLLEEGLACARRSGDPVVLALLLSSFARRHRLEGDYSAARALIEESLLLWRRAGRDWGTARSLLMFGHLDLDQGEAEAARAHFAEALKIVCRLGDIGGQARVLEGFARSCQSAETALRLVGHAGAIRERIGEVHLADALSPEPEELRRELRQRLGDLADTVEAEGRALALEEAVRTALATA